MKEFACKDVGMACDWKTQADDQQTLMKNIENHARSQHGIRELTQELKDKVMAKIHEIKAA